MFEELPIHAPIVQQPDAQVLALNAAVPGPPEPTPPPSAEAVQAAEAVFAAEERESQAVAGLLGLWTGTALLHDLARDHLDRPADEELDREEGKPKKKDRCK
jgi:hypothetical protein